MKNLGTMIAAVVLAAVLILYMCTFQVRFTEVAIKKTWGKPAKSACTAPGLYFKWPPPIQTVVIYDKRTRILEDRTEETRTIDRKTVVLSSFTLWRISDPSIFHTNFPDGVKDGEEKLRTTVVTRKLAVTGQHSLSDFISTDPKKRKIRTIENEIRDAITQVAMTEFGIEIVDFGIKKLGLPTSVTIAIFQSMKSDEEKNTMRYIAEGEAKASQIIAEALASEARIMAEAQAKAKEIETEAERIVSQYYEEFTEYPELRIFLDTLNTIGIALRDRTTLILSTEEPPFNIFNKNVRDQIPLHGNVLGQGRSLPDRATTGGGTK